MTGRFAVVTGGSSGIGRAISVLLAGMGHRVVALGRDPEALATLEEFGGEQGLRLEGRRCDVTSEEQVEDLFGSLDPVQILVNNAGTSTAAPLARTSVDDWDRNLRVNATSAFLVVRAALPGMRASGWGRIVSIASTAAKSGAAYTSAYTASKHAMLGLCRVIATEVAGSGVTSNAVCPTFVRTAMTDRSVAHIAERTGRDPDEARAALAGTSPLGRLLEPDEVAAAVGYLVSEQAGCVNGQSLVLDGGGLQL